MAGETTITVVGNLVADPELLVHPFGRRRRFLPDRVHPRSFDKNTNEWDGESLFLTCSVWRQYAENVAESLTKGTRVIVTGRLEAALYETREGREAHRLRDRRRRRRPCVEERDRQGERISRDGGGFSGGGGNSNAGGGFGGATTPVDSSLLRSPPVLIPLPHPA